MEEYLGGVGGVVAEGEIPFINGWTKESVLALPKGQRPNPSVYLDGGYIASHLQKFRNGASYLVPKDVLDRYGRSLLGMPDNSQFVMPASEMDDLLQRANGNVSQIEAELGIPAGAWSNKELIRINISNPEGLNLRMPSGNELGANNLWLPGGKLPTGYSEAIVNDIPAGNYQEVILQVH